MGTADRSFGLRFADLGQAVGVILSAFYGVAEAQEVPFQRVHEMGPGGTVVADWDGDGDSDLTIYGAMVVENVDHGRFELRNAGGPPSHLPLAAADLDLDGSSDLVTVDTKSPYNGLPDFGIWINPGGGAFVSPTSILSSPVSNTGLAGVVTGDLDGDGDPDLYAFEKYLSSGIGGPDTIFVNDGSGRFSSGSHPPSGTGTRRVELSDFDLDGDLDVVRADDQTHALWLNDGAGLFSLASHQPVPSGTTPFFLRTADLNADGTPDFLTGNPPRLYANRGEGRFADFGTVLPKLGYPYTALVDLPLMDLSGDEVPDSVQIVDAFQRGYPVRYPNPPLLFRNGGTGVFEADAAALRLPDSAIISAIADVDGDHDLDLVGGSLNPSSGGICSYSTGQSDLWLNDGEGFFTEARDLWETRTVAGPISAGDLDGDSFPDVLAFVKGPYYGDNFIYLYRNLRDGGFQEEMLSLIPQNFPASVPSLGDIDGDGDLDAFAGRPLLLLNDGHGGFSDATALLPDPTFYGPYSDLADLDGDGDLDLLLVVRTSSTTVEGHVWLNDGLGNFVDQEAGVSASSRYVYGVVLGDVDSDLDLDALVFSYLGQYLWLNEGNAAFVDVSSNVRSSIGGHFGVFADIDGDDDLDCLSRYVNCIDECETYNYVALNDGQGVFSQAQGLWPEAYCQPGVISTADFDEDGDLDVIDGHCGFWLNDGTGYLEDESYELPYCGYTIRPVTIQDFDLDGDLDLWYAGVPRPVMNVLRHVSWRSYPRVGKPLTMEVFGPAGTPFKLFSAENFIAPQTTDFGYLRLPARGLRFIASGMLDASGQSTVTFAVPNDRALPGSTVYWQALVGSPPRLTNLEFTRFSDL